MNSVPIYLKLSTRINPCNFDMGPGCHCHCIEVPFVQAGLIGFQSGSPSGSPPSQQDPLLQRP